MNPGATIDKIQKYTDTLALVLPGTIAFTYPDQSFHSTIRHFMSDVEVRIINVEFKLEMAMRVLGKMSFYPRTYCIPIINSIDSRIVSSAYPWFRCVIVRKPYFGR